jgi:hypothetical protein
MKYNSLELRWLQKKSKDLLYPNMLYVDKLAKAGGCFFHPRKGEVWVGCRPYDLTKGMIVVSEVWDDNDLPTTIAHEWRHYLQYHKFGPIRGIPINDELPYRERIKRYFEDPFEKDALLYSHKIAPGKVSSYWVEIINT